MTRAILALFLVTALAAAAQYPSGGQRKSRLPEAKMKEDPATPRLRGVPDPMIAIERELPSLATDLKLTEEQKAPWRAFERAVRDVAELSRQRTKKLLAPRPLDAPAPAALAIMTTLGDDDRMRAEAMSDVIARLMAVQEKCTPEQKSLLDRRVMLALSEPLGMQ